MSQADPTVGQDSTAQPSPPPASLEEQFQHLVAVWRAETALTSSLTEMVNHPAYQKIIGLGPQVVPLLLRELEREPDYWFAALRALTGANPVAPAKRGKLKEMTESWLCWGKEHGQRW
jgi:hypothetical protein